MRFDYFIIWQHGLKYQDQILGFIRQRFEILMIQKHTAKSIKKLIRKVYSKDYVPYRHLKSKTKYLRSVGNDCLFVFVKNEHPIEKRFGRDKFEHTECLRIKIEKCAIRSAFNPDKDSHVVHASDNEKQTLMMLKYLGYPKDYLRSKSPILNMPYYLKEPNEFELRMVPIDEIRARIIGKGICKLEDTPHYNGNYKEYLDEHFGKELRCDYSVERFKEMENLKLDKPIILDSDKVILDGVHRAVIAKKKGQKEIWSALI